MYNMHMHMYMYCTCAHVNCELLHALVQCDGCVHSDHPLWKIMCIIQNLRHSLGPGPLLYILKPLVNKSRESQKLLFPLHASVFYVRYLDI